VKWVNVAQVTAREGAVVSTSMVSGCIKLGEFLE
jgi:hypothetical protein